MGCQAEQRAWAVGTVERLEVSVTPACKVTRDTGFKTFCVEEFPLPKISFDVTDPSIAEVSEVEADYPTSANPLALTMRAPGTTTFRVLGDGAELSRREVHVATATTLAVGFVRRNALDNTNLQAEESSAPALVVRGGSILVTTRLLGAGQLCGHLPLSVGAATGIEVTPFYQTQQANDHLYVTIKEDAAANQQLTLSAGSLLASLEFTVVDTTAITALEGQRAGSDTSQFVDVDLKQGDQPVLGGQFGFAQPQGCLQWVGGGVGDDLRGHTRFQYYARSCETNDASFLLSEALTQKQLTVHLLP